MTRYVLEVEPSGAACWAGVEPGERLRRAVRALAGSYGLRVARVESRPLPATPSDRVRELAAADPSLSLDDLAERAGCTPDGAKKALRRTPRPRAPTGERKVDCARRLLRDDPGLSAHEIARRCGCDHTLVLGVRDRARL